MGAKRADALVEASCAATGCSDFGDFAWRDGLDALMDAAEHEADLNEVGLGVLESWCRRRLENRLRVVDWARRHPELRDERIERPLVVVGMLRTGTTILSELLARDPANRPLMKWEGLACVPPPRPESRHDDPRIAEMIATVEFQMQMVPAMKAVHYEPGDGPTECVALLTQAFRAQDLACGLFHVPSYTDWYRRCELAPAYAYHRLCLSLLQSGGVRGRWSLKAPGHMHALDALLAVYPDARLIVTHRDPCETVPSAMSLTLAGRPASLTRARDREAALRYHRQLWLDELGLMVERLLDFRRRRPEVRCFDLHYEDFMAAPVEAVRRAYAHFGEELGPDAERAMRAHLAANPRGRHGRNDYSLAAYGLRADEIRERFADYLRRFDLGQDAPRRREGAR